MTKDDKIGDEPFCVRSYGKGELALLYSPGIQQQSAVAKLNEWIGFYPGLRERLAAIGLRNNSRRYTPAQVRLIIEAIGEP